MVLSPQTTNPISVRHVFGYKMGKAGVRQKWEVPVSQVLLISQPCCYQWSGKCSEHINVGPPWINKDSSVSALKMPELPGIFLSYCSLWSTALRLWTTGKWCSVTFSGGSQKTTMTNKLIWALERPAYIIFLKEPNTLLTVFKGLHWKLLGGTVHIYWWSSPIKTGHNFWQQCSAEKHLHNRVLEKKPSTLMEIRIAKDAINSQYVLEN